MESFVGGGGLRRSVEHDFSLVHCDNDLSAGYRDVYLPTNLLISFQGASVFFADAHRLRYCTCRESVAIIVADVEWGSYVFVTIVKHRE